MIFFLVLKFKKLTMGIKGTVKYYKPLNLIRTMEVGDSGYIHPECLILAKKTLFLYIDSEVLFEEEFDDENENEIEEDSFSYHFKITRVGKGFTAKDFEIDLSGSTFEFDMEGESYYNDCMNNEKDYVIFRKFDMEHVDYNVLHAPKEEKESSLEDKLAKALDDQDYEEAAKLRNRISSDQKEGGKNER